jgi:hypothetical protein
MESQEFQVIQVSLAGVGLISWPAPFSDRKAESRRKPSFERALGSITMSFTATQAVCAAGVGAAFRRDDRRLEGCAGEPALDAILVEISPFIVERELGGEDWRIAASHLEMEMPNPPGGRSPGLIVRKEYAPSLPVVTAPYDWKFASRFAMLASPE